MPQFPIDFEKDRTSMPERLTEKSNVTPETFLECYRKIRDAKRDMDEAAGKYGAARKRAKDAGIDMRALGMMLQLSKLDDDEIPVQLKNMINYCTWGNVPIGSQATLFGPIEEPSDKAKDDFQEFLDEDEGIMAGKNGHGPDSNPHLQGTERALLWERGRKRGAATLKAIVGEKEKKVPGRKKKGGNPEDAPSASDAPDKGFVH